MLLMAESERDIMEEKRESKPTTEATPEQASAFIAELFKDFGAHLERQNKFKTAYANNFHFEQSAWDLKIIFGQLEQHTGTSEIDWHTAITIPWLQVKLVAYFLRLQAAWNEMQNGYVAIPASVMPKEPEMPVGELANIPVNVAWYEVSKKIYKEMFGDTKTATLEYPPLDDDK
jgi:hypothetical protein